jgi:ferredoxin
MRVTFVPLGRTIEVQPDETILEIAERFDIPINSVCHGRASCAECKVRVLEGMKNTVKPGFMEKSLIGNTFFITKERLACQLLLTGDVVIDVSEHID